MTTGRRVRFTADFDYKPTPQSTIAYRAGQTAFVRKECAERAIKLGRAVALAFKEPTAGVAATIAKRSRRKKSNG
jgi:hypothetical protein